MRVLQVINSLATGGAEKLLLDSIPKYSDKGIQMDLLLLNGTAYPFYQQFKAAETGVVFELGTSSVYNPLLIFKIIKYLKGYDVVHVHLFPALYWVALAKWISFSKVTLVFTEHSIHNRRMNSWVLRRLDRFIYSKYSKISCITEEVKVQLQKNLHFAEDRFVVIANGIDLSKINRAQPYLKSDLKLSLPDDSKLLLQVSSFQYPKDQATVIKSLRYMPSTVHLLLVGEGVDLDQSKKLVQDCNLNSRVHFLGVRMDVHHLLKTVDIVVLSSQYEGLSLSCVEGLASGKPFIASDVPGLREVVQDSGLLFPYQDEKKLAAICTALISDTNMTAMIVSRCLLKSAHYAIETMIENYVQLYQL